MAMFHLTLELFPPVTQVRFFGTGARQATAWSPSPSSILGSGSACLGSG
jgi:hypothetical protein